MLKKKLLVDVDGVVCPLTDDFAGLAEVGFLPSPIEDIWYHPEHGPMLTEFAREHDFELVWCTYWGDGANEILAPLLGTDEWPVIELGASDEASYRSTWKYTEVLIHAAGHPLAWLDDEHERFERGRYRAGFLRERQNDPTKLVTVKRDLGLAKHHLNEIAAWAKTIEA